MSDATALGGLVGRIVAVHEQLDAMGVVHQFGGAIALAWYRSPRATIDVDLNITLEPERSAPVLGALELLGVSVTASDRRAVEADGQVRLDWSGALLDLFFATLPLHEEMAERAREVRFGPTTIPILSPEDLIICKAIFDRPKDWIDIDAIVDWGTQVDATVVLDWIERILGDDSGAYVRAKALLSPGEPSAPGGALVAEG